MSDHFSMGTGGQRVIGEVVRQVAPIGLAPLDGPFHVSGSCPGFIALSKEEGLGPMVDQNNQVRWYPSEKFQVLLSVAA